MVIVRGIFDGGRDDSEKLRLCLNCDVAAQYKTEGSYTNPYNNYGKKL